MSEPDPDPLRCRQRRSTGPRCVECDGSPLAQQGFGTLLDNTGCNGLLAARRVDGCNATNQAHHTQQLWDRGDLIGRVGSANLSKYQPVFSRPSVYHANGTTLEDAIALGVRTVQAPPQCVPSSISSPSWSDTCTTGWSTAESDKVGLGERGAPHVPSGVLHIGSPVPPEIAGSGTRGLSFHEPPAHSAFGLRVHSTLRGRGAKVSAANLCSLAMPYRTAPGSVRD